MKTSLIHLKPGHSGRVVAVGGTNGSSQRMMAMGLVPGTLIRVERVAPLGDPIEVRVRGYNLMLRKAEATEITVHTD